MSFYAAISAAAKKKRESEWKVFLSFPRNFYSENIKTNSVIKVYFMDL